MTPAVILAIQARADADEPTGSTSGEQAKRDRAALLAERDALAVDLAELNDARETVRSERDRAEEERDALAARLAEVERVHEKRLEAVGEKLTQAYDERDTLAARLAEVERERDDLRNTAMLYATAPCEHGTGYDTYCAECHASDIAYVALAQALPTTTPTDLAEPIHAPPAAEDGLRFTVDGEDVYVDVDDVEPIGVAMGRALKKSHHLLTRQWTIMTERGVSVDLKMVVFEARKLGRLFVQLKTAGYGSAPAKPPHSPECCEAFPGPCPPSCPRHVAQPAAGLMATVGVTDDERLALRRLREGSWEYSHSQRGADGYTVYLALERLDRLVRGKRA